MESSEVEEPIPSPASVVRVTSVSIIAEKGVETTSLRRPIQHLIPLELHSACQEDKVDGQLEIEEERTSENELVNVQDSAEVPRVEGRTTKKAA